MPWVCLMYHDVVPRASGGGGGAERFSVSVSSFERVLDAITATGRVGCSLDSAIRQRGLPRVAITFDDGTAGQFEHALPALRERGMSATFFVTTDWVGKPGFMSWDQLRELTRLGMSVQSHTKSHPFLSELGDVELRLELIESKRRLDDELKQDTTQLAFPGGNAPRRRLRPILAQAGYEVIAGSRWGVNSEARGMTPSRDPWIRRCTAPTLPSPKLARRVVRGDLGLGFARRIREVILFGARGALGASRYARWRRRILDTAPDSEASYADR